jgi:molybdenum cofactor synthesis domain-containing protein
LLVIGKDEWQVGEPGFLFSHEQPVEIRVLLKEKGTPPGATAAISVTGLNLALVPDRSVWRIGDGTLWHAYREGENVYLRLRRGGLITTGDMVEPWPAFRAAVVTLSDKGSQGLREDTSGTFLKKVLEEYGASEVLYSILPDEREQITALIKRLADLDGIDLIVTTGGTGLSPRDVTPEATMDAADRLIPGMAEAMRAQSLAKTPHAMISRAVAAQRGRSLIINLPGSRRGAEENLQVVAPALPHALTVARGQAVNCATLRE